MLHILIGLLTENITVFYQLHQVAFDSLATVQHYNLQYLFF